MSDKSREQLMEEAFFAMPTTIGGTTVRSMSALSFALLDRLKNPLVVGGGGMGAIIFGVAEYVWLHSTPLAEVMGLNSREEISQEKIAEIAQGLSLPECMSFLRIYKNAAERLAACMIDVEEEGEPGKPESLPTGLQVSFSPVEPPVIPSGSDTFSGSSPSSVPMPTSTLPASPAEPPADGFTILFPEPKAPHLPTFAD